MTRRRGANLDQDVAVPLPAAGGGGSRTRRRPTRVRRGRLRRRTSRRDLHSKHAKKLSRLQARQRPAPRRCAGARGHPESAAHRGADADVLRARGAGSGAADRKGHPRSRLCPSAAERVFEPSPPCKGSGPTLRRLLHGARDGGARLGNPGSSTLRMTGVVRLRADHLLREVTLRWHFLLREDWAATKSHPRAATTARATSTRMRGPACQPAWGRPTHFRPVRARRCGVIGAKRRRDRPGLPHRGHSLRLSGSTPVEARRTRRQRTDTPPRRP